MVRLKLTAKLTDAEGNPLAGKPIEFYKSYDKVTYTLIETKTTNTEGIAETTDEIMFGTVHYKARFPGDETYESSEAEASYTVSVEAFFMSILNMFLPWLLLFLILATLLRAVTGKRERR